MVKKRTIGFEIRTLNNLIYRYVHQTRPEEVNDFTAVHGWAIRYFYENRENDVFQRDFENHFSIRRSTATRILQLMEKNELITRESVPYDARLKKIILTEKAIKMHMIIDSDIERLEKQLASGLTTEELTAFFQTLDKIKKNCDCENQL